MELSYSHKRSCVNTSCGRAGPLGKERLRSKEEKEGISLSSGEVSI